MMRGREINLVPPEEYYIKTSKERSSMMTKCILVGLLYKHTIGENYETTSLTILPPGELIKQEQIELNDIAEHLCIEMIKNEKTQSCFC